MQKQEQYLREITVIMDVLVALVYKMQVKNVPSESKLDSFHTYESL